MLALLTTAGGGTEVALLLARLRDADVPCMRGGAEGPRGTTRRALEIYVDEDNLDRARAILEEDRGGFDEEELARLSDEAGRRWAQESTLAAAESASDASTDTARDVTEQSTPTKQHRLRHALQNLAGHEPDTPGDPFGRSG
jgi:hypothetical protein